MRNDASPRFGGLESTGLLTDLYQLTMAAGYFKLGLAERESVFHLFFRKSPFGGGYAVACGLSQALEFLREFRFTEADVAYLGEQVGNDGKPLFELAFLDFLLGLKLAGDLDAVPEGTVVFPQQPLLRLRGPMALCQILETPLLTMLNFQTLIATKASRICGAAAGGDAGSGAVIEFGLRRAQGIDGGMSASRAAYVGGCIGTSNVLAGRRWGIPIKGTHAHSWVMSFPSEPEAFDAYAEALPNNCVFLVDTYDTLEGVRNAVRAGERLRARGHEMVGIRLDSGDLAELSIAARRLLDDGGFPDAAIVASNDLDEEAIEDLRRRGARIDVWGVGTKLATAYKQPALGGVYKLAAYRAAGSADEYKSADERKTWRPVIKLSEEASKISNPGIQQVARFRQAGPGGGRFVADVLYDEDLGLADPPSWIDADGERREIPKDAAREDLLVPAVRDGRVVYTEPPIDAVRDRAQAQLRALPEGVRRLRDPQVYSTGLDPGLWTRKEDLVAAARRAALVG